MYVDNLEVEEESLAGQRMVEVEEHCIIFDLYHYGSNVTPSFIFPMEPRADSDVLRNLFFGYLLECVQISIPIAF